MEGERGAPHRDRESLKMRWDGVSGESWDWLFCAPAVLRVRGRQSERARVGGMMGMERGITPPGNSIVRRLLSLAGWLVLYTAEIEDGGGRWLAGGL